jgi:predicted PolB exonuclease-like 3'-5' exonuclease
MIIGNGYTREINEFIRVKLETNPNNTAIARSILKHFGLNKELENVRKYVSGMRRDLKIIAKQKPIKRLFFDIETGYYLARTWRIGNKISLSPDKIKEDKKIICISYKWQYEDKVHTLTWSKTQSEKEMLKRFIKIMGEADEILGHNGDNFDIKVLRTRCIANGIRMFPTYRTLDTLKKAREYFSFASNKLDYLGRFLQVGEKMKHEGFQMWVDIVENNCRKALKKMVKYCERDVTLLEDVYFVISPYIYHNTNFAVLKGGELWECPECASDNIRMYKTYTTAMGVVRRNMKCKDCNKQYRISNKTYLRMLKNEHLKEGEK